MPGRIMSMNATLSEGDPVRVTSGVYEGSEGIIEDLQPECSAIRIHTKAGNVYALLGCVEKIMPPSTPMRMPKRSPIKK
jgi:hypothetical protein